MPAPRRDHEKPGADPARGIERVVLHGAQREPVQADREEQLRQDVADGSDHFSRPRALSVMNVCRAGRNVAAGS